MKWKTIKEHESDLDQGKGSTYKKITNNDNGVNKLSSNYKDKDSKLTTSWAKSRFSPTSTLNEKDLYDAQMI